MANKMAIVPLVEIRALVANYMDSEGCSCCRNIEEHERNTKALAKLLKVRKYPDGSGYDFPHYVIDADKKKRHK